MMFALAFTVVILIASALGAVVWVGTGVIVGRLLGKGRASSIASLFFGAVSGVAAALAVLFVAASVLPDPPLDPNGPQPPRPPRPPAVSEER